MDTPHEVVTQLVGQFKLSDTEIAKRVGSTQPTIWRLRAGKSSDCSASLFMGLVKLRDELAITQEAA